MYEEFYGFRDNPFRLTPDPDYLFLSANHQEALGHLLFGVKEGSGVVVITGEIGAGKTTLLRTLVRNLDSNTIIAYIFNPALSAVELLQTINAELGLPSASTSKKELIDALNRFLLEQQAAQRRVVVIVDEAQDLDPGVLEQLRLLSNLETEREKLLQIMLVGQPELRDILARPELAQLDQRVTLRWHLGPLDKDETAAYIHHRIRVAAEGREPAQFTSSALAVVYRISRGIPRLVNVLCHRALLIGYTREERRIDRPTILQAAKELGREDLTSSRFLPQFSHSSLLLGVLFLLSTGVLVFASTHGWLPTWTQPRREEVAASSAPPTEEAKSNTQVATAAVPSTPEAHVTDASLEKPHEEEHAPPAASPTASSATSEASVPSTPLTPPVQHTAALAPVASSPPVQQTPNGEDFLQVLQKTTMVESAVQSTNGILRAWGANALQSEEWRAGAIDLSAIARARRLEYLPVSGAFPLLSLLDLPAILELTTPVRHEPRFALLLNITEDRCRLLLDREYEAPLQTLTQHWLGKAHVFWKDFENVGAPLALGSVGQQVRRLYTLLAQTPEINARLSPEARRDTYSKQTEEIVARFQKSRRLTPDGVVGPQTMISLYNTVPSYRRPSLSMVNSLAQADREEGTPATTSEPQSVPDDRRKKTNEHNS